MHMWISNDQNVLEELSSIKTTNAKDVVLEFSTTTQAKHEKALGLKWDTASDVLKFNINLKSVSPSLVSGDCIPTKKEFLKTIMSIYDPLGFLSCFTIKSKIIMQDVWTSGVKWDEKIRKAEFHSWKSWLSELSQVAKCCIPRCYISNHRIAKAVELHMFCDASTKAYAAVGY